MATGKHFHEGKHSHEGVKEVINQFNSIVLPEKCVYLAFLSQIAAELLIFMKIQDGPQPPF